VNNKRLQNAFVWISKGLENYSGPSSQEEVLIDQLGCVYKPHVIGVQVGQPVTFLNSDTVFHNVRTVAKNNAVFNEMTPTKNTKFTKKFMRPEIMITAKCDVHPWMGVHIGVIPHPFFAVSNEKGEFSIENVPAGTYTFEAWHEIYGRLSKEITVTAENATETDFTFTAK